MTPQPETSSNSLKQGHPEEDGTDIERHLCYQNRCCNSQYPLLGREVEKQGSQGHSHPTQTDQRYDRSCSDGPQAAPAGARAAHGSNRGGKVQPAPSISDTLLTIRQRPPMRSSWKWFIPRIGG